MHQPFEYDNQGGAPVPSFADKGVDFNAIVAKMTQVKPQPAYPMVGWGKKVFIQATCKKAGSKVVVEFFVENTFGTAPLDPKVGYTAEEATLFKGVQILDYEPEPDKDDFYKSQGEVLHYEAFADEHITDPTTRVTLDRVMDAMADSIPVNEGMLDRINNAWENREPGSHVLYEMQYM